MFSNTSRSWQKFLTWIYTKNSLDLIYLSMNTEMYKETQITCFDIFQSRFITCLFPPYWTRDFYKEFQLLLRRAHFFFEVFFLCSCISVLLVTPFFRDEVLGAAVVEGPLGAIQKKEKLRLKIFKSNPSSNNTKQSTKDQITQNFSFSLHSSWETNLFHHF